MWGNNKIDNTYNIFLSDHVGIATGSMQYAKKYNSLNIYNPHANSFVPSLLFTSAPSLNPMAKVFFVLNHYAPVYTPLDNRRLENIALLAMFCTILILSVFLMHEIKENVKSALKTMSPKDILKKMKLRNANKIIIGHLNINSIRNKIEDLKYLIAENIDILLISETKLNNTFPESQFLISGFQPPYWEDRNEKGGGFLLYVREHIPSKKLNINFYPKFLRHLLSKLI